MRASRTQITRHSGFTVIELMITLAIAAVLAVLAAPTFNDLIEKSRLRGATDDLVSLLNSSRANAVKLQYDINVSSVGSGTTWCVGANSALAQTNVEDPVPTASKCDCRTACLVDSGRPVVDSSSYSGVAISLDNTSKINNSQGGLVFSSKLGSLNPLGSSATVNLQSKTQKYKTQITVAPLGQVYACTPASSPFVSGYPSC